MASLGVGAQPVYPPVSTKPLDGVPLLPAGLSSYVQQYVAPPVPVPPCVSGSVMPVPAAPPLYTGMMPSSSLPNTHAAEWHCDCAAQQCCCVGASSCFGYGYPIDVR